MQKKFFRQWYTKSQKIISWIEERVRWIAPVRVYPGEFEMQALYEGALRTLNGVMKEEK